MKFQMGNDTYDFLRYMAQIVIPALAALWVAIAKIWGLPYGTEIGGTLMAIDTFLGAILKVSTDNYWDEQENEQEGI